MGVVRSRGLAGRVDEAAPPYGRGRGKTSGAWGVSRLGVAGGRGGGRGAARAQEAGGVAVRQGKCCRLGGDGGCVGAGGQGVR
jgi:hypothetical protein